MKNRIWKSLIMGVVLFSLIFLVGCGTLETLVNKDGAATSFGDFIGGNKTATLPATATLPTDTTSADTKTIVLYFADSTGKYLVKEPRTLPKTASVARETVNQWLKGPDVVKGTSEQALVPATTVLLGIAIKDNVATVDLSKEFMQPNTKVTPEVALYGLVNTLTQYSTIKQVQIRVEGKPLTKYGVIDATMLVNKTSLVKETAAVAAPALAPASTLAPALAPAPAPSITNPITPSSGTSPNSPSSMNLFNYPASST